jgi:hypothetical protein
MIVLASNRRVDEIIKNTVYKHIYKMTAKRLIINNKQIDIMSEYITNNDFPEICDYVILYDMYNDNQYEYVRLIDPNKIYNIYYYIKSVSYDIITKDKFSVSIKLCLEKID